LDRQAERELKDVLANWQNLRLTKISQMVPLAESFPVETIGGTDWENLMSLLVKQHFFCPLNQKLFQMVKLEMELDCNLSRVT
jgi:hypothetical protein